MLERRFIRGAEVRAKQGDKPGIAGVAAVYDQQYDAGWFTETIKPGAFNRALSEKQDVRCLFNHDANNLLARTKSGTLRLEDSPGGLKYDADTDQDTTMGRDVVAMIARGDLDGCSFSFIVRSDVWRDEFDSTGRYLKSYRDITDLDLFDVGPVTFPAYTQTSVGVRSSLWPDGIPAEIRSHVPALRDAERKTKRIDGEDLTLECFAYRGDDEKTDEWKLPIKFSTEEKTKTHIRNAIARFDQTGMPDAAEKKKAWSRIKAAAEANDIEISAEDEKKSKRDDMEACDCDCIQCGAGDCEHCSADPCVAANCRCERAARAAQLLRARAHILAASPAGNC